MNIFEKMFGGKKEEEIKRLAYKEAEIEESNINPNSKYQSGSLRKEDEGYMKRVEEKAQQKANDPQFIKQKENELNNIYSDSGIKPTDELYKSGHGILDKHNEAA